MRESDDLSRESIKKFANSQWQTACDLRLQALMDRNNNGDLSQTEREELESLVESSELFSLMKAKTLEWLKRHP